MLLTCPDWVPGCLARGGPARALGCRPEGEGPTVPARSAMPGGRPCRGRDPGTLITGQTTGNGPAGDLRPVLAPRQAADTCASIGREPAGWSPGGSIVRIAYRRYCSMAGVTRVTISSGLALASGSTRMTWRSVAMPISCAATVVGVHRIWRPAGAAAPAGRQKAAQGLPWPALLQAISRRRRRAGPGAAQPARRAPQ